MTTLSHASSREGGRPFRLASKKARQISPALGWRPFAVLKLGGGPKTLVWRTDTPCSELAPHCSYAAGREPEDPEVETPNSRSSGLAPHCGNEEAGRGFKNPGVGSRAVPCSELAPHCSLSAGWGPEDLGMETRRLPAVGWRLTADKPAGRRPENSIFWNWVYTPKIIHW